MSNSSSFEINTSNKQFRLSFLDGLRAIAALWVLWGHCNLFAYGWDSHKAIVMAPLNVLLYLHLGVVVFLVLSGICLGLPLIRNKGVMHISTAAFFKARAFRILPPYLAILSLILLVNFFVPVASWGRHDAGLTPTISWQVLIVNFTLMQDFFPWLNSINGPFWSIALEWHLYFLFPVLAWLLRRSGGPFFLIIGAILAWGLNWISGHLPEPFLSWHMTVLRPAYFLFLFVLGIFSAWFAFGENQQERMRRKWLVLAPVGLIALVLFIVLMQRYPIVDAQSAGVFFDHGEIIDPVFAILVTVLLIWLTGSSPKNGLRRVLESRILTRIGGFSYSVYLVHIPILAILNHAIESLHLAGNLKHLHFVLLMTSGTTLSLAFAWVFSRLFETGLWWRVLSRKFVPLGRVSSIQ